MAKFPPASYLLRARTISSPVALNAGTLLTLGGFLLKKPVTYAKTGGNGNLSVGANTGAITAAAALGMGEAQSIAGTATGADGVRVPWAVNLTGIYQLGSDATGFAADAAAGTYIGDITGVPPGQAPIFSPNDGRVVVAGSELTGWYLVRGLTAVTEGTLNGTLSAAGAISVDIAISIGPGRVEITLDPTPVVHNEGNSGQTVYTFTVSRTPSSGALNVDYFTFGSGLNPANDQDFVGGSLPFGTLNLPDGQGSGTITVTVASDTIYENTEEFTLQLANLPANATLINGAATAQITNDDVPPVPTFSLSPLLVTHLEGDAGTTLYQFVLNRNVNQVGTVVAQLVVEPDPTHAHPSTPARFGGSFPSFTATFPNGSSSLTISVLALTNTIPEPTEGFRLRVVSVSVGTIVDGIAQGVIQNDDAGPYFTVDQTPITQYEGSSGVKDFPITVYRAGDTSQADTITLSRISGSASATDFVGDAFPSISVTFPIGSTVQIATPQIKGDVVVEGPEDFIMALGAPPRGIVGAADRVNCTILDGAQPPVVIPTLIPGASYTGMLDSGGYTPPAKAINGAGWDCASMAHMSVPFERGALSSAFGQVPRQPQSDAWWWIEDTASNYVSVHCGNGDPAKAGIQSVTFVLEGSSVTLTGDQLWTYNPMADDRGATVRLESSPSASLATDCRARLYAIIRPFNGEDLIISTVIALNTDGRFVRPKYYVDPVAGNDANAGTLAAPWKTMEYWLHRQSGTTWKGVSNGGIVYHRTATPYMLGTIQKFGNGWSGTLPISVRSWPGEEASQVKVGHAVPQNYRAGANRISARVLWENTRIYKENLVAWAQGHVFSYGTSVAPQSGDWRGPQSLGYPEGNLMSVYSDAYPFRECSFIDATLDYPFAGGIALAVKTKINFGDDGFRMEEDHRGLIKCDVTMPFQNEYRMHNSINLTVASVQANTPSAGKTKITFVEPVLNGSNNTESYLRVLTSANNLPVGNVGYPDMPNYKGYFIASGAANLNAAGGFAIVSASLALQPGDVVRIWSPPHCDSTQAIQIDASTFNKPKQRNFGYYNVRWLNRAVQMHFWQNIDLTAGWYNQMKAGYTVTTAGTALTLNLAANDATRPWAGNGTPNPPIKMRLQKDMVVKIGNERRLIRAKIDDTHYVLDSPFTADVTNSAAFDLHSGVGDVLLMQTINSVSDPGFLRGLIASGVTNVAIHSSTFDANYTQFVSGAYNFSAFDSILPAFLLSSELPRNSTLKNNHYGNARAGGGGPSPSVAYDTDGQGTAGAVTFDVNKYPTAGVAKTVGGKPVIPFDIYGRPRLSTQKIGAVSDPRAPGYTPALKFNDARNSMYL